MKRFVAEGSIVRQIWGDGDTILLIFAGAAAEFALNKAADWLYFTGRLPAAPLSRLFSTVAYSREIVFSEEDAAIGAIESINKIHARVERSRNDHIPQWAYRDVLFMLIDYSIRSFELLNRKLTPDEKEEVFHVFHRVGMHMHIDDLPGNLKAWQIARSSHINQDLEYSMYTKDLFRQYRKHLGLPRYILLTEVQKQLVPTEIKQLLRLQGPTVTGPFLSGYKFAKFKGWNRAIRSLILPGKYLSEINEMDLPYPAKNS